MDEVYLIFFRYAHSTIAFVRGASVTDAIWNYLREENSPPLTISPDGSVHQDGVSYPHVLAYVEANYKIGTEWQIRHLPKWAWTSRLTDVFCGESEDGPREVVNYCRPLLRQTHPRSRARAFVWYLNQGTLVTFYRKTKPFQIEVLGRYLYNWNGKTETIEEWHGDYQALADSLSLEPYQLVP